MVLASLLRCAHGGRRLRKDITMGLKAAPAKDIKMGRTHKQLLLSSQASLCGQGRTSSSCQGRTFAPAKDAHSSPASLCGQGRTFLVLGRSCLCVHSLLPRTHIRPRGCSAADPWGGPNIAYQSRVQQTRFAICYIDPSHAACWHGAVAGGLLYRPLRRAGPREKQRFGGVDPLVVARTRAVDPLVVAPYYGASVTHSCG